jgi:2-methylcitrate dehydratase
MITECSYKAFPTEALTHQPISAAIQVCEENQIDPDYVKEILVETTTRGADILSDPSKYDPQTKETADHSLPYVIAAAVADGNVLPDSFSEEKLFDPRIRSLLGKIKVVADPVIDSLFPEKKRARVHITTQNGNAYSAVVDHAKGSPENPMSDEEIIAKFRANSGRILSKARQDQIIDSTMAFENIRNMQKFMSLLVP